MTLLKESIIFSCLLISQLTHTTPTLPLPKYKQEYIYLKVDELMQQVDAEFDTIYHKLQYAHRLCDGILDSEEIALQYANQNFAEILYAHQKEFIELVVLRRLERQTEYSTDEVDVVIYNQIKIQYQLWQKHFEQKYTESLKNHDYHAWRWLHEPSRFASC